MKTLSKLLLIPTLLIGLALPSQAQNMQTTQPSPVKLGVKGGLNFSNFNGDALDADYMTRGNVGLFLKYDVNPYFAIQPEANISWTGAKMSVSDLVLPDDIDPGESGDVKLKQTYIQIPVLAKLQLPSNAGIVPNIYAGPVVSFNIHDKFSTDTDVDDIDGDLKDIGLDPNTTQFGLQFGAGVEYQNVMIDARYHWGLTDTFDDVDAKNSAFMIAIGFGI